MSEKIDNSGKIKEIISDIAMVHVTHILDDSTMSDLNFDSLDCVQLIMELEDEFNINIPDEEAEKLKTVGEIITYVKGTSE